MKTSRFTERQIKATLKQADASLATNFLDRQTDISLFKRSNDLA